MVMPSVGGAAAGRVAAVGGEAGALLLGDAGEQGLGVADGVAADAAFRGVDGEHELAAPGRAAVAGVDRARLEAEEIADQRPREKLDHEGDGRPLVAAEGELRAGERRRRVRRRNAVGVDPPPFRDRLAVAPVDHDLAARARARSLVEAERPPPLAARPRERHRVGAVERLRASSRRDVGHRGHEREADEAALGEGFGLRPQGREVVGVGDREGRDSLLARQGDERLAPHLEGERSEAVETVDLDHAGREPLHLQFGGRVHLAGTDRRDVARHVEVPVRAITRRAARSPVQSRGATCVRQHRGRNESAD